MSTDACPHDSAVNSDYEERGHHCRECGGDVTYLEVPEVADECERCSIESLRAELTALRAELASAREELVAARANASQIVRNEVAAAKADAVRTVLLYADQYRTDKWDREADALYHVVRSLR